jgi:hypothetical protein
MVDPNFSDATWQKSSYSNDNGVCVETAVVADTPGIRDSKLGDRSPVIVSTPAAFAGLLAHVKGGAADLR